MDDFFRITSIAGKEIFGHIFFNLFPALAFSFLVTKPFSSFVNCLYALSTARSIIASFSVFVPESKLRSLLQISFSVCVLSPRIFFCFLQPSTSIFETSPGVVNPKMIQVLKTCTSSIQDCLDCVFNLIGTVYFNFLNSGSSSFRAVIGEDDDDNDDVDNDDDVQEEEETVLVAVAPISTLLTLGVNLVMVIFANGSFRARSS